MNQQSTYVLEVHNHSDFTADTVVVRCPIPAWVAVNKQTATAGTVTKSKDGNSLQWTISSVRASGTQKLELSLTPRQGRAFDLDVDLAVQPRKSRNEIAIHEGELSVSVSSSDAVDETGKCLVTITNVGTATVAGTVLYVISGQEILTSVKVGELAAKASQQAQVVVSASAPGSHPLTFSARTANKTTATGKHTITIRRAVPVVRIAGPAYEFSGAESEYVVTVSNTGNAAIGDLNAEFELPDGVKYLGGIPNANVTLNTVQWQVDSLKAGGKQDFSIQVKLDEPGSRAFVVAARVENDVVAKDTIMTAVDTTADLKLTVNEPAGPQSVGKVVEYELVISNTGTKTAGKISLVAVCPPELEAVDVTGNAVVKNGQIFFRPIDTLPHGTRVTHKIKVRAKKPGNHSFRVFADAADPGLKYAAEDTTRYFDRSRVPERVAQRMGLRKKQ